MQKQRIKSLCGNRVADLIAMLYRDEYYDPGSDQKNVMEVIIAKQRNGKTGTVKLNYLKEYQHIEDLNPDPQRSEP